MEISKTWWWRGLAAVVAFLVIGVPELRRTANPPPWDYQSRIDLATHPVASYLGSLLPALIVAVAVFFLAGLLRWLRPPTG